MSKKYITLREGFDYLYVGEGENKVTERVSKSFKVYRGQFKLSISGFWI